MSDPKYSMVVEVARDGTDIAYGRTESDNIEAVVLAGKAILDSVIETCDEPADDE